MFQQYFRLKKQATTTTTTKTKTKKEKECLFPFQFFAWKYFNKFVLIKFSSPSPSLQTCCKELIQININDRMTKFKDQKELKCNMYTFSLFQSNNYACKKLNEWYTRIILFNITSTSSLVWNICLCNLSNFLAYL